MTPPIEFTSLSSSEKDALITALLARIDALGERGAALEAENAALRERLKEPPKTPDNSGTPPSQGHKASGASKTKPKSQPHVAGHTGRCIPTRRSGATCWRTTARIATPT